MLVTHTRAPRLYTQAYDQIRELLRLGKLRPGEIVLEMRIAERLGMSRTPVREAVRMLVAENILEATDGGVRVPLPTTNDFAEVYFLRAALEAEAARIATATATSEFLQHLDEHFEVMRAAVEADRVEDAIAANSTFHRSIVDFTNNKRIKTMMDGLENTIIQYRAFSLMVPEHMHKSLRDHRDLIGRMQQRDEPGAAEFARGHILRAGGRVVRALRSMEGPHTECGPTASLLMQQLTVIAAPEDDDADPTGDRRNED